MHHLFRGKGRGWIYFMMHYLFGRDLVYIMMHYLFGSQLDLCYDALFIWKGARFTL